MTTTWHADGDTLTRYAGGDLDDVRASSLEAHLLTCERCRERMVPLAPAATIDRVWDDIVTATVIPRPGLVERGLLTLGVRDDIARLLSATPSLRMSWFLAEALVLGFASLAANRTADAGADVALFLFLVMAALAPVAGVAVAFGRGVDPTYEIGVAAPMRGERLLLMRALAVLATSLAIAAAAALTLPGFDRAVVAWLLPALGLTLATITLATWIRPIPAAVIVSVAWLAGVALVTAGQGDPIAAFHLGGQGFALVVIAVSAAVLARRRSTYEGGIVS